MIFTAGNCVCLLIIDNKIINPGVAMMNKVKKGELLYRWIFFICQGSNRPQERRRELIATAADERVLFDLSLDLFSWA